MEPPGDKQDAIDAALQKWRQGDCVLGNQGFVHRFDPKTPLTQEAADAAKEGGDLSGLEVLGLAVVTQSCDIVRSWKDRPFIEVVPLVEIDEEDLGLIQLKRRPQYAYVPSLAARHLVADLDRVMTVEKAIVAGWSRTPGCTSDPEVREFSEALARKRSRFAFPDAFNEVADELQVRIQKKHPKLSEEGAALRALREIRVRAGPSWDADKVELTFWFIRNDAEPNFKGTSREDLVKKWMKVIPESARFSPVQGVVVTLEDMTAADYVESDLLDLDYLSRE